MTCSTVAAASSSRSAVGVVVQRFDAGGQGGQVRRAHARDCSQPSCTPRPGPAAAVRCTMAPRRPDGPCAGPAAAGRTRTRHRAHARRARGPRRARQRRRVGELAAALGVSSPSAHRLLSTLHARDTPPGPGHRALHDRARSFALAALATDGLDLRTTRARTCAPQRAHRRDRAPRDPGGGRGRLHRPDRGGAPGRPISRSARVARALRRDGRRCSPRAQHEVDALLARGLERYTDRTPVTRTALESDRELVRSRGYAINEGSWRARSAAWPRSCATSRARRRQHRRLPARRALLRRRAARADPPHRRRRGGDLGGPRFVARRD